MIARTRVHRRSRVHRQPLLPHHAPELIAIGKGALMLEVEQLVIEERLERVVGVEPGDHVRPEQHD